MDGSYIATALAEVGILSMNVTEASSRGGHWGIAMQLRLGEYLVVSVLHLKVKIVVLGEDPSEALNVIIRKEGGGNNGLLRRMGQLLVQ